MHPLKFEARIYSRRLIAKDTYEVTFDVSPAKIDFTPGQYLTLTLPNMNAFPITQQFHDFSICSSPNQKDKLSIVFRSSESPFKKRLINDPSGSAVFIEAPKGIFTIPEEFTGRINLIAGGVGVTPFMSMLKYETEMGPKRRYRLLSYNNSPETAPYLEWLQNMKHPDIEIVLNFGKATEESIVNFLKNSDPENDLFYIAGPPGMVQSIRSALEKTGVNNANIKTEEFSGYANR